MNQKTNKAVMGERTPARDEINPDGILTETFPSFEDIQRMAGFATMFHGEPGAPFDGTIEAVEAEREGENDDTRTIGLPANEENSDDRAWNEIENHRDDSDGQSDAERNL